MEIISKKSVVDELNILSVQRKQIGSLRRILSKKAMLYDFFKGVSRQFLEMKKKRNRKKIKKDAIIKYMLLDINKDKESI